MNLGTSGKKLCTKQKVDRSTNETVPTSVEEMDSHVDPFLDTP